MGGIIGVVIFIGVAFFLYLLFGPEPTDNTEKRKQNNVDNNDISPDPLVTDKDRFYFNKTLKPLQREGLIIPSEIIDNIDHHRLRVLSTLYKYIKFVWKSICPQQKMSDNLKNDIMAIVHKSKFLRAHARSINPIQASLVRCLLFLASLCIFLSHSR